MRRRGHWRGSVFGGDAVFGSLRAGQALAEPEGVCHRRRTSQYRNCGCGRLPGIDLGRNRGAADRALFCQKGQPFRRQKRTAPVHRLCAPQFARRPALHQNGLGAVPQHPDLFSQPGPRAGAAPAPVCAGAQWLFVPRLERDLG